MKKLLLFLVLGMMMLYSVAAEMTGGETMTRTVPATVTKGVPFTVTYSTVGASGTWGLSIVDNVEGGCTFPSGGTQYKSVMLSEDGTTKTITMQSPNADANCVFTGDYKFGSFETKVFSDATVVVGTAPCPEGQVLCGTTCAATCGVCTSGATESCTVDSCAGTKTCSAGAWGSCVKTVSTCGVTPSSDNSYCDIAGKLDFFTGDNDCTIGTVVGAIILVVGILLLSKK
jgi:hypothetical protein